VEDGQALTIGGALVYVAERYLDGRTPLREALQALDQDPARQGLDPLAPYPHLPDLVGVRVQEVAFARDRLRGLGMAPGPAQG